MAAYKDLTKEELLELKSGLQAQFEEVKARGLKLDMSRGKPAAAQLNLSMEMMNILNSGTDLVCEDGVDCRNYGGLDGIAEAKQLLADMMEVPKDNVIVFGNSSLNVMYDTVARAIDKVHSDTTSILTYNNENSLSCVISLAYYSARNYYTLVREMPSGKGFADIVFIPHKNINRPAIVVELKWNSSADAAIEQIRSKNYTDALKGYSGDIILVGINYDKTTKKHSCVIESLAHKIN